MFSGQIFPRYAYVSGGITLCVTNTNARQICFQSEEINRQKESVNRETVNYRIMYQSAQCKLGNYSKLVNFSLSLRLSFLSQFQWSLLIISRFFFITIEEFDVVWFDQNLLQNVFQINIFKNLIEFLQDKILRFSRSNIRRFQKRKNYQKTIRFKRGREIDRKFLKKILFTPSSWSLLD